MAFDDLGENMTKKMGPFPVWVWGVLIGGAFVLWYWVSQRDAGSSALADTVEEGTVATPSGDFSTVPVMPASDDVVDENTNLEWSIQALNAITGTGTSLLAAQTAISKYLNSEKLSAADQAIIEKVLRLVGPPPEGVSTPDLTPVPDTPAASNDTVTTLSGPTSRRFRQSLVLTANVRWRVKGTRFTNPSGRMEFIIDGEKRGTVPVVNGTAIYVTTPFKGMESTKDNRWIARARFLPAGTAKASDSDQHVVTIR